MCYKRSIYLWVFNNFLSHALASDDIRILGTFSGSLPGTLPVGARLSQAQTNGHGHLGSEGDHASLPWLKSFRLYWICLGISFQICFDESGSQRPTRWLARVFPTVSGPRSRCAPSQINKLFTRHCPNEYFIVIARLAYTSTYEFWNSVGGALGCSTESVALKNSSGRKRKIVAKPSVRPIP